MHSDRLCRLLHANGYYVDAFEMHTRVQSPPSYPFAYHHGRSGFTMIKFLISAFIKRPSLIHLHLSSARRVFPLFPVIVLLSCFFKVILTIHSGSFEKRVAQTSFMEKMWMGRGFRSVAAVIAVGVVGRDILVNQFGVPNNRVHLIPAYLSPPVIEKSMKADSPSKERVWFASGYATSIYFWEGLIDAVKGLTVLDELVLVFYTKYDQPYFDNIVKMAESLHPLCVTIHRDLSPEDFQKELSRSTLFIRPTLTDGDSIALREALSLGKTVVASDAVERPSGCVLFHNRDVDDLRQKLIDASGLVPPIRTIDSCDFSMDVLALYHHVLRES